MEAGMNEVMDDGQAYMNDVEAEFSVNAEAEADEDANFFVKAWIDFKTWLGFGS